MLLPLFQWFYPRSCLGCGVERPEALRFLCWDCWSLVRRVELPFCDRCGDPIAGAVEHRTFVIFVPIERGRMIAPDRRCGMMGSSRR